MKFHQNRANPAIASHAARGPRQPAVARAWR